MSRKEIKFVNGKAIIPDDAPPESQTFVVSFEEPVKLRTLIMLLDDPDLPSVRILPR